MRLWMTLVAHLPTYLAEESRKQDDLVGEVERCMLDSINGDRKTVAAGRSPNQGRSLFL